MSEPLRVVIADDHAPMRGLVRRALERDGVEVVAEAEDADGAVEAVQEHAPAVALLDVTMPGSGIAAASRISTAAPDTAVVMLTVSTDDTDLFGALQAGAAGYLLKDLDLERLPNALRAVLRGEPALPRALVSRVIDEFRTRGHERNRPLRGPASKRLTDREWEVLELLGDELTTKEIAERLFVSTVTVRSHVSAILRKLQVTDRNAAVRLLREQ